MPLRPQSSGTSSTRLAIAVTTSLAVHAAALVMPIGMGLADADDLLSRGVLSVRISERAEPQALTSATEVLTVVAKATQPSPPVAPVPSAAPQAGMRVPATGGFGFSMLQNAPDQWQSRAWQTVSQNGADVANDTATTMAVQGLVQIGFPDPGRGHLRVVAAAVVAPDGHVEDAFAIEGDDAFIPYAVEAVRRTMFQPVRRDGEPAKGYAVVTVDYCPPDSPSTCPNEAAQVETAPPARSTSTN